MLIIKGVVQELCMMAHAAMHVWGRARWNIREGCVRGMESRTESSDGGSLVVDERVV